MGNVNEYKIVVRDTLEENRYNLTLDPLAYTFPIVRNNRGPSESGGVPIPLDKPVNNKHFDLSGQTESGNFESFTAFERFNPQTIDSVYNDRSYDPVTGTHTLEQLRSQLRSSGVSGSDDEAFKIEQRFTQDSSGNYVVRTVKEQRIWLKEFIDNPGLIAKWNMYGGEYDWRTVSGSTNNGTPIYVNSADIEPDPENRGRGTGNISFNVGGRL